MHAAVVVPGIMGTELFLPSNNGAAPEKVWPPTALETQFGYKRRAKLADPHVVPGEIIGKVMCFDFYDPLFGYLENLGFTVAGTEKCLIKFPYDWRRDLFEIAGTLAAVLDDAHARGASRISLVAHSMGGLICRLLLESPTWRQRPWYKAVDQLIAIATPHLGAPLALGRVLGIDSTLGISGEDFAWLANQDQYPSAYQLLPAPGEAACWNQSDPALASLNIYTDGPKRLGLNPKLLTRADAVHQVLAANTTPDGIRYFYFAGTGHRTATRINVFERGTGTIDPARTVLTRTIDGGDGTVPLYSALPRIGQRQIVVNEHATAFKGDAFRRVFVRLLGGDEGPALEALLSVLALSIEAPVVSVGDEIEVLLHAGTGAEDVGGAYNEIRGELVLQKIENGNPALAVEVRRLRIDYSGPPVNRVRFYLEPVDEPGHYTLSFFGSPADAPPEAFGVCEQLPRALSIGR